MSIPKLRAHGAEIPALGFGTSPMTGSFSAEEVVTALKAGYRHIDTARKYGTERQVGEAIRASGVPRGDIFLTTKVSHENLREADFARSVDESLKALNVDYFDLLMIHWPNLEIPVPEAVKGLAKAKRQGVARHIGIANFNTTLIEQALKSCAGTDRRAAGGISPLSRPDEGACGLRQARPRFRRLLPARPRPAV